MAIPFLNHIDLTKSEIRRVSLHQTTTSLVGTEKFTGQIIFDTGDSKAKYYDGSNWIVMGDTDTNNYVNSASLSGTTLTLGREGLSDLTVNLSGLQDGNDFVDGASLSNNTLTLTRTGSLSDLTVDLSSLDTDDNYVDSAALSGTTLTLGRTGSLADLTVNLSSLAYDNYVDSVSLSGTTLTIGRTGVLTDLTVDLSSLDETVNNSEITVEAGTYLSLGSGQNGVFTLNQSGDESITINHDSTSRTDTTSNSSPNAGSTFTAVDSVTTNTQGHVTAINVKTVTLPSDNNTDTLQSIAADTSNADRFITSVASASGAQTGFSHSTLRYNPSTETLKVTNLIITGTSTTVNTEEINLADSLIRLNSNFTGSTPSENAGIEVERGTRDNVQLNWDEADDDWEFTAYNHAGTPALATYKIPRTYSTTVGNGSATSINVDHNLGTRKVIVQTFDSSSYDTVYCDVVRTNTNRVTLNFAAAPANGDITVLISTCGA